MHHCRNKDLTIGVLESIYCHPSLTFGVLQEGPETSWFLCALSLAVPTSV